MPYNAAEEVGKMWWRAFLFTAFASLASAAVQVSADETVPAKVESSAPAAVDPDLALPAPLKASAPSTDLPAVDLLQRELPATWKCFSSKEGVTIDEVWAVTAPGDGKLKQLNCVGEPKGFLYTQKQYSNFVLTFEWQVSEANANSGVLVYTQEEPRLWPTSMQVQLHQPQAGDIFPSGDADGNATQAPPELAKEVGMWNQCEIVSLSGQLSVKINGRKAGEVSGCKPSTGFIALQSEGSKTRFRKLLLQELPPSAEDPERTTNLQKQPAGKTTAPVAVESPPAI